MEDAPDGCGERSVEEHETGVGYGHNRNHVDAPVQVNGSMVLVKLAFATSTALNRSRLNMKSELTDRISSWPA